jgi:hypothetical protein
LKNSDAPFLSKIGAFSQNLIFEIGSELVSVHGLSPTSNGGDDADFFAGFDGGFLVLEESDVFAVDVDVDEAADVALSVQKALADAGIFLVEGGEEVADGGALDFDGVEVIGQGTERRGDGDGNGHKAWGNYGITKFSKLTEWEKFFDRINKINRIELKLN